MTKTLLTLLLSALVTGAALAQTDKDEIKKSFSEYFQTVEQKDNARTLDYIYPRLFDHFPKDRILQAMDKMKADTTKVVTLGNGSVSHISETMEANGIKFVLLKYSFEMTMTFLATGEGSDAADFTYEMFKEEYGEKNVVYNREASMLSINMANEMYAINDPEYSSWKFLEKKENMKPVLEKLIPKSVLKNLE